LARLLQSLLYETRALDASSYAGATVSVLVIAAVAASVPAIRAMRVNPMVALRDE